MQEAEQECLSADGVHLLRYMLARRVEAFGGAMRGDPPARVEPIRVQLKPRAEAVKSKAPRYNPVKTG